MPASPAACLPLRRGCLLGLYGNHAPGCNGWKGISGSQQLYEILLVQHFMMQQGICQMIQGFPMGFE